MDREPSPSLRPSSTEGAPVDVVALCERVRSAAREAGTAVRGGWAPHGLVDWAPDRPEDPDHHLWRNGGVFWIAFTVHAGVVQERVRLSLGTADRALARRRRDAVLALFARARDLRISLRFRPRRGEGRRESGSGRRRSPGERRNPPNPPHRSGNPGLKARGRAPDPGGKSRESLAAQPPASRGGPP